MNGQSEELKQGWRGLLHVIVALTVEHARGSREKSHPNSGL